MGTSNCEARKYTEKGDRETQSPECINSSMQIDSKQSEMVTVNDDIGGGRQIKLSCGRINKGRSQQTIANHMAGEILNLVSQ